MPDDKSKHHIFPNPYRALTFTYDRTPYRNNLTFRNTSSLLRQKHVLQSNEPYYHVEFGLYTGDGVTALQHATGVINALNSKGRAVNKGKLTRKQLLAELIKDYKNYGQCIFYGLTEADIDIMHDFTEIMLSFGLHDEVYRYVNEYHRQAEEDAQYAKAVEPNEADNEYDENWYDPNDDRLGIDQILDFGDLYIKEGDRCLFLENDPQWAMNYYRLASIIWHNSGERSWKENKSGSMTPDYWSDFCQDCEAAFRGASIKAGNDDPIEYRKLCASYNSILQYDADDRTYRDTTPWKSVDEFFTALEHLMAGGNDVFNKAEDLQFRRLGMLMACAVYRKYLINVLSRLARDEKQQWNLARPVIEKLPFLKSTRFGYLTWYGEKIRDDGLNFDSDEDTDDIVRIIRTLLSLARAAEISEHMLQSLRAEVDTIAYYAPIENFKYMLPEKCQGNKSDRLGKLTVMHLSYMNDPNEGHILRKALYGSEYLDKKPDERVQVSVPYVFIKCFTPRVDYLPMWEMYADYAHGCCIVIDWKKTREYVDDAMAPLYRVCYLKYHDGNATVLPEMNPQIKDCQQLEQWIGQLNGIASQLSGDDKYIFDALLGGTIYLFKDASYSYEQELRVMYEYNGVSTDFKHTDTKNPLIFVQPDFPIQLKEVILGPKFEDVYTRVPYLQEEIEKMCRQTGIEMPKITVSGIKYR